MIANPRAFYLLSLLLPIFLLHLVRRRRKHVTVSSLMIWDRVLKSSRRIFLTSRLLRSLLLLLQVLFILLLVLSLAGVSLSLPGAGYDQDLLLIMDVSMAMQADFRKGSRFDEARRLAEGIIRDLSPGQGAMIMTGSRRPGLSIPYTTDRRALLDGLKDLEAGDETGDMKASLRAALSAADTAGIQRIILITGPETSVDPSFSAVLEIHRVGEPGNNLAVTAFSSRRPIHGRYALDIFIEATNYGTDTVEAPIIFESDGEEIRRFDGRFPPGEAVPLVFPYDGLLPEGLHVRIDHRDMLVPDNEAFLVLREHRRIRVLLVTPGNPYLETLLGLVPGLETYSTTRPGTDTNGADLVIYDRIEPPILQEGRYMFIHTLPPGYDFRYAGDMTGEGLTIRQPEHPLVQDRILSGISIEGGAAYTGPDTPLVVLGSLPVLSVFESPGIRWIRLSPDLYATDLLYRPAFPVLVGRCLQWLAAGGVENPEAVRAGDPLPGGLPFTEVSVLPPSGEVRSADADGRGRVFTDTSKAGFYTLYIRGREKTVAVNPAGGEDSNLLKKSESESAVVHTAPDGRSRYRSLDPLLLTLALLILAAEGYLAAREERT